MASMMMSNKLMKVDGDRGAGPNHNTFQSMTATAAATAAAGIGSSSSPPLILNENKPPKMENTMENYTLPPLPTTMTTTTTTTTTSSTMRTTAGTVYCVSDDERSAATSSSSSSSSKPSSTSSSVVVGVVPRPCSNKPPLLLPPSPALLSVTTAHKNNKNNDYYYNNNRNRIHPPAPVDHVFGSPRCTSFIKSDQISCPTRPPLPPCRVSMANVVVVESPTTTTSTDTNSKGTNIIINLRTANGMRMLLPPSRRQRRREEANNNNDNNKANIIVSKDCHPSSPAAAAAAAAAVVAGGGKTMDPLERSASSPSSSATTLPRFGSLLQAVAMDRHATTKKEKKKKKEEEEEENDDDGPTRSGRKRTQSSMSFPLHHETKKKKPRNQTTTTRTMSTKKQSHSPLMAEEEEDDDDNDQDAAALLASLRTVSNSKMVATAGAAAAYSINEEPTLSRKPNKPRTTSRKTKRKHQKKSPIPSPLEVSSSSASSSSSHVVRTKGSNNKYGTKKVKVYPTLLSIHDSCDYEHDHDIVYPELYYAIPQADIDQDMECHVKQQQRRRVKAAQNWFRHFEELIDFRMRHGHCAVPQKYKRHKGLGIWVNKIRQERKELDEGRKLSGSMLNELRMRHLEAVDFDWGRRRGVESWFQSYRRLLQYSKDHGHCNVPTKYENDSALGRWVSTQRREYKNLQRQGRTTYYNNNRYCRNKGMMLQDWMIQMLTDAGFQWEVKLGPSARGNGLMRKKNENEEEVSSNDDDDDDDGSSSTEASESESGKSHDAAGEKKTTQQQQQQQQVRTMIASNSDDVTPIISPLLVNNKAYTRKGTMGTTQATDCVSSSCPDGLTKATDKDDDVTLGVYPPSSTTITNRNNNSTSRKTLNNLILEATTSDQDPNHPTNHQTKASRSSTIITGSHRKRPAVMLGQGTRRSLRSKTKARVVSM